MPRKIEINRRQFLISTSAAAIGVVARGADAQAGKQPQQFRSPAGSVIPYSSDELMMGERQAKVFTGPALAEIAFPLGGIGTGTVSLGGRGQLRDWEIFNRPGKGKILPFSFTALWVRPEGQATGEVRVVEAPLEPPFTGSGGYRRNSAEGLPRLRGARFQGDYPFAKIDFDDESLPVGISLEAFNPFVPLAVDDSSLPVAVFRYHLHCSGPKAVDLSLAFSLLNAVGYDGKAILEGTAHPGFGGNINRLRREQLPSGAALAGLDMSSTKYSPGETSFGSMALLTDAAQVTALTSWGSGDWWDPFQKWYDAFAAGGEFHEANPASPSVDGRSNYATLAPHMRLGPGESTIITFLLAWYFPTRENDWNREKEVRGQKLHNDYATRFQNAWDVGRHTAERLPELEAKTRTFQKAFFQSTLPGYVLEAVSSQAAILRTNTCMLLDGKQFFAFEGCDDNEGCCPMNCTHVWNYEQALAFLFPELERSMRHTDFTYNMRADGSMAFRTLVPVGLAQWSFDPAADGQMGCIMKLYREWQISGDDRFLKDLWPQAKRALEFAWSGWDMDRDGIMEGEQQTTYDNAFFGPNSMTSLLYLGALRAGELMAAAAGDADAAGAYRQVREKGVRNLEQIWNGEFYVQKIPPVEQIRPLPGYGRKTWYADTVDDGEIRYQFGDGCLSDQLLGAWFARVIGLDVGCSPEHTKNALRSIYRYNFMSSFYDHPNMQRIYALNDEKGLLLCSWPKGGRPRLPFVYSDEVWTGIEYQVAAHMIYEGLLPEGLSIVKGICDRYDGVRRNPWNEVECGSHYSRALASWSVLLALSGYGCSAKDGSLTFMPAMNANDFRCFFSTASGWGTYHQKRSRSSLDLRVEVLHGEVQLRHLYLANELGSPSAVISVRSLPEGNVLANCRAIREGNKLHLDFGSNLRIETGKAANLRLLAV